LTETLVENYDDPNLKAYKKRVIQWLTQNQLLQLNAVTFRFLLGFDLDASNPNHQKEEMEAMKLLSKTDYARWRELILPFTQMRDEGNDIWVNALYMFKCFN
ncbi:MAG: hypothetical protein B6I19_07175, partial [Bacteroidetes bacterium 4572_114]